MELDVELKEPPTVVTRRGRVGVRRAAALLLALAALGGGCVQPSTAYAAARAPGDARPRSGRCPTDLGRIACVDLTRQLMWVQDGGRPVFGPVRVRTGRAGYVTRTGRWHIYLRDRDRRSRRYDVAMPYSQFFSGGEAFHGLDGESMDSPPGSHGCVNMNTWDARTLWGILSVGDPVQVFGRKPGT